MIPHVGAAAASAFRAVSHAVCAGASKWPIRREAAHHRLRALSYTLEYNWPFVPCGAVASVPVCAPEEPRRRSRMSLLKRVSALFAAAACCWLCLAGRADAQGVTPTPEMLQIFQGLTPEQQQAILGAVTGGASGGSGGGLSSLLGGGGTGDRSKDLQAVQADRRQQKQQAEQVTRPSGSDEEEADAATS